MTQGKAPKYIQERRMDQPRSEAKPKRSLIQAVVKGILGTIGLLSAVLGIVSGWVALVPHVSATQTQPLNVTDPFSTPFIVANEGPLGIRDVTFECFSFSIERQGPPPALFQNMGFVPMDAFIKGMKPGERATVPCFFPVIFKDPLQSADVVLIVRFKVPFIPWVPFENDYRFQTSRAGDGNLYWFPQPLTSPIPDHTRIGGPSSAQGVNKSQ